MQQQTDTNINQPRQKVIYRKEGATISRTVYTHYQSYLGGFLKMIDGQWQKWGMPEVCPNIEQWHIERSLFVNRNRHPALLKEISSINFPLLKEIYAAENQIESLECLSHIEAPLLQVLWIAKNNIVSLRPLRKIRFPLSWIRISDNKISDCSPLSELAMPEMNQIMIEFNKFSKIQSEDLKFTIKLSGSQPVTQDDDPNCFFNAFASGRINQKNILEQLKKKYPKIGLGVYFSTMQ